MCKNIYFILHKERTIPKIRHAVIPILIVGTVFFLSSRNIFNLFAGYFEDDQSIFSLVRNQFCISHVNTPQVIKGKNLIVLRLDDVQGFARRDISIQMIEDAYKYNAPIVAGVIPKDLYKDEKLVKFLERENCNIEIAMHGWDHSGGPKTPTSTGLYDTEFGKITYKEAQNRVKLAKEVLEPIAGGPILSFIPPYNIISKEGKKGVQDAGLVFISSIGKGVFDYHSTTYNFDQKRIVPVAEIVSNCNHALRETGLCVVMMHPQDYANKDKTLNTELYQKYYLDMLDQFSKKNVVFVTFKDVIHKNNK